MAERPIRTWFYADCRGGVPVKTTGRGFPDKDEHGETMFCNTHFEAEADAWKAIVQNARAAQELRASLYRDAQEKLVECEKALAEAAARRTEIEAAFERAAQSERAS